MTAQRSLAGASDPLDGAIVLIGAARSGTKYLRDILASSSAIRVVPYDINYVWRYGNENHPDDRLPVAGLAAAQRRFIRGQLDTLAPAAATPGVRILEKSVSNTVRVPFVRSTLPEARFIHLIRDGRAVTESTLRQWQQRPDLTRLLAKMRQMPLKNFRYLQWYAGNLFKGLVSGRGGGHVWGVRYPGILDDLQQGVALVRICARQWRYSVEYALDDLAGVPAEAQCLLRYEDLHAGTDPLQAVCRFCGIEDGERVLAAHAARFSPTDDARWRATLSADEQAAMLQEIGPLLDRLGY